MQIGAMATISVSEDWWTLAEAGAGPVAEALGVGVPTLLAASAALLAFVSAVAVGLAISRRGRVAGGCPWKRDAFRPETRFRRWVCATCGVDAYTVTGRPPRECKRASRPSGL